MFQLLFDSKISLNFDYKQKEAKVKPWWSYQQLKVDLDFFAFSNVVFFYWTYHIIYIWSSQCILLFSLIYCEFINQQTLIQNLKLSKFSTYHI